MRVLYFTRDYTPHDYRFLSALAGSQHQVFWLRLERRGLQLEDRPLPPEVQQISWRGGQSIVRLQDSAALFADFKRVLRVVKPDLVHAGPIQTSAFLTAAAGFQPLVSMSWGSDMLKDADGSVWMRWKTLFTLKRTSVLIGDCQAVSQKAVSFGFPKERVVLFPWGVDLQQFSPGRADEFLQRLGWQDQFVLLSLRSWEPIYGVDLLVRAFARAAQQIPQLRLLLLGGGSQSALIHQILAKNDLLDRVYLAGQVSQNELVKFYRAADLYVSASHSDGSSVSLMEALACGKPVLVSDIPGNCEWITPGREGWLFQDGNEDALLESLLHVYDQTEALKEAGLAARALAEKRANWTENFKELLKAYQLACDKTYDKAVRIN
ncbi:MAG TPA: glycosyltransferase family 4 protein [Anaerolineaceae bacterium]|nr:glycosyltransferase family 4 protein [Anaerolineaceae bacterium]